MKIKAYALLFTILTLGFCLSSCKTQKVAKDATVNSIKNDMKTNRNATNSQGSVSTTNGNVALTLADYLRRVSGVSITGSGNNTRVKVRGGTNSISGADAPIFVLDGAMIGNDYSSVESMIDINDIDKVKVLRDAAATQRYGMQAAAGAIVIYSKKN